MVLVPAEPGMRRADGTENMGAAWKRDYSAEQAVVKADQEGAAYRRPLAADRRRVFATVHARPALD